MIKVRQVRSVGELRKVWGFLEKELGDRGGSRNYQFYENIFKKNPGLLLVAVERNNEIVGAVFGSVESDHVLLGEMAVGARDRRSGLGKKLLQKFEKSVIKMGMKRILLGAVGKAEGFYLKCGYEPKLFVQINSKDAAKKMAVFLKGLDAFREVTWKDGGNDFAKVIIKTGVVDKQFQGDAAKITGGHTQYLFSKQL